MGAWDFGPFDNDDASDWIYELEESSDTSVIADTLAAVTEADADDLETLDCTNAIAAAEIVAALCGNPCANLPDEAKAWVEENEGLDASPLIPDALTVVKRIRTNSELKDLWDESKDAAKWYASLDDLTSRLKA
ncbi:MAG TPA: DUF4259 domain-containing protein [Verrucomicrobiales bacterium]|jgi:hypothetical protein|nr:DUF4259 domain-containing protein [Verrucomicrobiales bacterium]